MAKKKSVPSPARIHVRAKSQEQLYAFHAYARRHNTDLSKLVVATLQRMLDLEAQAAGDAEQI